MKYPESWISLSMAQGDHGDFEAIHSFGVPWRSLPRVTIAKAGLASAQLTDVADWGEGRAQQRSGYRAISFSEHYVGDYPAMVREYEFVVETLVGSHKIHCQDLYALRASAAYDVSFCAEESDWPTVKPTFDEMMLSVRFGE